MVRAKLFTWSSYAGGARSHIFHFRLACVLYLLEICLLGRFWPPVMAVFPSKLQTPQNVHDNFGTLMAGHIAMDYGNLDAFSRYISWHMYDSVVIETEPSHACRVGALADVIRDPGAFTLSLLANGR